MPTARREDGAVASLEVLNIAGATVAALVAGSGIALVLPEPTLWMLASAYLAPASLAFAAWWWVSQKE